MVLLQHNGRWRIRRRTKTKVQSCDQPRVSNVIVKCTPCFVVTSWWDLVGGTSMSFCPPPALNPLSSNVRFSLILVVYAPESKLQVLRERSSHFQRLCISFCGEGLCVSTAQGVTVILMKVVFFPSGG